MWRFGTDGTLTLPGAVTSQSVAQVGQRITCMDVFGSPLNRHLFNSTTFAGGVYSDIQVGWTVSNGDGWAANVTGVDDPAPGFITIDDSWDHVNYKLISFTSPTYQAATAEDLMLTSDASSLTLSANGSLALPNSGGVIKSTDSSTIINGAYKSFTFATGAFGPGPGYAGNGVGLNITPESEQIKVGWTCTFSNTETIFTVTVVSYLSNTISINFDNYTDSVVFPMVANSPTSSIKLQPVEGGSTWTFSGNGTTIFPGDLIGSGASPAPSINGFSSATFSGNVSVGNISATNLGNISSINKDGNASNILYGNGVFAAPTGGASISNGNSNVNIATANGNVTIAAVGNTTMTVTGTGANVTGYANITGNVTAGNVVFGANAGQVAFNTGAYISGNANSISRDGSIVLQPYTGAGSTFPGVVIGGAGRLIAPNGSVSQIFNTSDVTFQVATKVTVGTAATTPTVAAVIVTGGIGASGTTNTGVGSLLTGPTFTPLANTVAGFNSNVNSYTQVTLQNKSNGADATTDYVLTADNGSDTVNYGDFGIINSGYDANTPTNSLGNIVYAADTYLYAQGNTGNSSQSGGNLAIGTTVPGKNVKIFAGGVNSSSIIANISNTGIAVNGNVTATNFSGNISITGNVTGTSPNVTLVAGSYSYTFDNTGILTLPSTSIGSGNEGGEIDFTKAPNSSLSGNVVIIDQYVDRIRFFESGGTTRGAYIDLSQAAAGVGTLLNNRVSSLVNAGTFVTMDNLKATVTTSGNRGLSLATVTGSNSYLIGSNYSVSGGSGGTAGSIALTTTATSSVHNYNFLGAGDLSTYTMTDSANGKAYRITLQVGASFNNNLISIERLV